MKPEHAYRFIGAVVVTVVLAYGVVALIQLLANSPLWTDKGAAWVGSIGTVGTLVGTIYLADSEGRRRRRVEDGKAHLAITALEGRLNLRLTIATSIEKILDAALAHKAYTPSCSNFAAQLQAIQDWSDEDLDPILVMEDHLAARLKKAQSDLKRAALVFSLIAANGEVENFYLQYEQILHDARRQVSSARAQLEHVSTILKEKLPNI